MGSRWREVSPDPNSKEAKRYRGSQLKPAFRPSIYDRTIYLAGMASGKTVLDVGCVDQLAEGTPIAPLHRTLARVAGSIVGVDIDGEGVESLRAQGFDVRLVDITDPGFSRVVPERFALIVAGEIVEHITDFTSLFANLQERLAPGGLVVLTTPNPHGWTLAVRNMVRLNNDNVDHTLYYFPSGLAEMCDRFGFRIVEYFGERLTNRKYDPLYHAARCAKVFLPYSTIDCESLVYVIKPLESS